MTHHLKKEFTWVKNSELHLAHERWREVWPCPLICDWSRFLNEEAFPPCDTEGLLGETRWAINCKGAERIRLIATSPHWKTLLKAMAVQYVDCTPGRK